MPTATLTPGAEVERDLVCRAPDGTSLRTDVYRPVDAGPRPALLLRLPYGRTAADSDVANIHPAWLAAQGFVVAVQDVRGRWASDGDFAPFATEAADGEAAIAWTSALDGCDGRVATYGFSYPGLVQLLTAARRPRALVAISPAFTGSQVYEGWAYQGGALTGFTVEWATELALDGAKRAGDHAAFQTLRTQLAGGDPWYHADPDSELGRVVRAYSPWLDAWLAHPTDDGFWDDWSAEAVYDRIDVPALHVGGFWDMFVRGTIRNHCGLRGRAATPAARDGQRLVLGPWRHMPWTPVGEPAGGPAAPGPTTVVDLHVQWWRHVLDGVPAPQLDAAVTYWVAGRGWGTAAQWPPYDEVTDLYLHSGGRAASRYGDGALDATAPQDERPDVLVHDPWMAPSRRGGHGCCLADVAPMGPACQCAAEDSPGVLVYSTPPLVEEALLLGDVTVEVWMSQDTLSADLAVRLCVVTADGCSTNLLEGVRRVRRDPDSAETGPRRCSVDLGPVAHVVQPGERLRLDVAPADHPLWDVNLTTGETWSPQLPFGGVATQVVFHDAARPSVLHLPVGALVLDGVAA